MNVAAGLMSVLTFLMTPPVSLTSRALADFMYVSHLKATKLSAQEEEIQSAATVLLLHILCCCMLQMFFNETDPLLKFEWQPSLFKGSNFKPELFLLSGTHEQSINHHWAHGGLWWERHRIPIVRSTLAAGKGLYSRSVHVYSQPPPFFLQIRKLH